MKQADSLYEASVLGKCLNWCEHLNINEFDTRLFSKMLDLQPTLTPEECIVIKLDLPDSFLVVTEDEAVISPVIERKGKKPVWSFSPESEAFCSVNIYNRKDISVIPLKGVAIDDINQNRTRAHL